MSLESSLQEIGAGLISSRANERKKNAESLKNFLTGNAVPSTLTNNTTKKKGYNWNNVFDDIHEYILKELEKYETSKTFFNVTAPLCTTLLHLCLAGSNKDQVSAAVPEMRVRFTAAHPKDFPDEVLHVINDRPNICKLLHLPAQSGSSAVLERMRRGYTREAYLRLVEHVKRTIPGVGLSTDMICGFCGETDEEFEETMTLMQQVDYNVAFLFPYSMREKTAAHRRYKDDVPDSVKKLRHNRMIELYRAKSQALNETEIGNTHLVLIEGAVSKTGQLLGRNEFYMKVAFDQNEILTEDNGRASMKPGDFVAVKITSAKSSVLTGVAMYHTSISEFYRDVSWGDRHVLRA